MSHWNNIKMSLLLVLSVAVVDTAGNGGNGGNGYGDC